METRTPIEELVKKVLSELGRLNYSYSYASGFRAFYRRMVAFAISENEKYFSIAKIDIQGVFAHIFCLCSCVFCLIKRPYKTTGIILYWTSTP